jgi:hypothetical protein
VSSRTHTTIPAAAVALAGIQQHIATEVSQRVLVALMESLVPSVFPASYSVLHVTFSIVSPICLTNPLEGVQPNRHGASLTVTHSHD